MKVNLSVVFEELKDLILCQNISGQLSLNLSDVRMYPFVSLEMQTDYLYMTKAEYAEEFCAKYPNCLLAITYSEDVYIPEDFQYVMFRSGLSCEEIFEKLQEVFQSFRQWENELYLTILSHQSPQGFLDVCTKKLLNPLALFDASYILIANSGELPKEHMDSVWTEVLSTGYYSGKKQKDSEDRMLWESTCPYQLKYEDFAKMQTCLRRHGLIVGYLGSTDILYPFTTGQLSILYIIQQILEKSDYLDRLLGSSEQKVNYIVERMLHGYTVEKSAVNYFLHTLKWKKDDCYQLYYFFSVNKETMQTNETAPTIFQLKNLFSDSIIYPFDEGILMIAHFAEVVADNNLEQLYSLIEKRNLACTASRSFTDFFYLRYAYLQCRALISYAQESRKSSIFHFYDYYEKYIIQSLANVTSLKALCNPCILSLAKKKTGREFIHSLKVYLMNGKNITDAASELYLHRNTLIYRIERMESILNIKFREAGEETLFYLYLSCVIVEELSVI